MLEIDVGRSEDGVLWRAFLQGLGARGGRDAHTGRKQAIAEVFVGASGPRCRVHLMRNLLVHALKGAQAMVAAGAPFGPRTIFEQADRAAAPKQLRQVIVTLAERFPKVVALVEEAAEDLLAF